MVGVALPFLWGFVEDNDIPLPFRPFFATLMAVDHGWGYLARVGGLAAIGLVIAVVALREDTVVLVGADDVIVRSKGTSRTIARSDIAGVYFDGHLIIESVHGRRLLDADVEGARKKAQAAFTRFGYPWEGGPT